MQGFRYLSEYSPRLKEGAKIVLCGQRTFGRMVLEMLLKRGDDIRLVSTPFRTQRGARG